MTRSQEPLTAYRLPAYRIAKLEVGVEEGTVSTKPLFPLLSSHQLGHGRGAGPHTHWKARVMIGAAGF